MTERLAAAALAAYTPTAPPASYLGKPGQWPFPNPQSHVKSGLTNCDPSRDLWEEKKMLPLLWKPTGVCIVTFKSIWQSARVSFPAPCQRLSEEGSLSCLRSVWAHDPQDVLLLNPMWHWRVFSITALRYNPDRFHPCAALTLMSFLTISATSAKEIFSDSKMFLCFFYSWIMDVSAGFFFLTPSNYFPSQRQHFPPSAKTKWATSCLRPSGTLKGFPELDKEHLKIILYCLDLICSQLSNKATAALLAIDQ